MSTARKPEVSDEPTVSTVSIPICSLCLAGAGGECHVPGCTFWVCPAPDAEQAMRIRDRAALAAGPPVSDRWTDPTYGRIDRDIQEWVEKEWKPAGLAQRVAIKNTLQAKRDRGERLAIDTAGSDVVNRLRQQADDIDPGLSAARFSLSPKARAKQEAIARHWKAAGIRTALIELALTDPSGAGE